MYLSCPKGKSIFISQALYGRRSLTICPNTNHRNRRNCGSYWRSLRISRRRCQNRQKCTLSAKNSMFYDPCRGVEKYLDVTWHCRITRELIQGPFRNDVTQIMAISNPLHSTVTQSIVFCTLCLHNVSHFLQAPSPL